MIIKPLYPRRIVKEPYYKGFFVGILIGAGIIYIITVNSFYGIFMLVLGIIIYVIETMNEKNFKEV